MINLARADAEDELFSVSLCINVRAVNDLDSFEKLVEWGVESVITNYPKVLYGRLSK